MVWTEEPSESTVQNVAVCQGEGSPWCYALRIGTCDWNGRDCRCAREAVVSWKCDRLWPLVRFPFIGVLDVECFVAGIWTALRPALAARLWARAASYLTTRSTHETDHTKHGTYMNHFRHDAS